MTDRTRSSCSENAKQFDKNLDYQKELQMQATVAFNNGRFDESVLFLNALLALRPTDVKVCHNLIVAEFYAGGLKNINEFKSKVNMIINLDDVDFDSIPMPAEPLFYVICYNMAVIYYHIKQFGCALTILNGLSEHIKCMARELAEKILLLLIQTYLAIRKVDMALDIIICIEKIYEPKTSSVSLFNDPFFEDASDLDSFKLRLLELKCKCLIRMGESCERALRIFSENIDKAIEKVSSESEEVFDARCKNKSCSVKLLTVSSLCMKKSYQDSVKTLVSIPLENNFELTGESVPMIVYNSLGCVHMFLKKPMLAVLYFRKSLEEFMGCSKIFPAYKCDEMVQERPLHAVNHCHSVLYNLGIALLNAGKPHQAFDCFMELLQTYHLNPRIWFRLVECCIMAHSNGIDSCYDYSKKSELLQTVAGNGKNRQYILKLRLCDNNKYSYETQSYAVPVPSLEFSSLCVRNAMLLLSSENVNYSPTFVKDVEKTNERLMAATAAAGAYVTLCLGDPVNCLKYTKYIFNMSNCSGIYKLFGHLYSAEAYLFLNKTDEAVEHLKPDYCNYISDEDDENCAIIGDSEKPISQATARATILYNLAVVYVMKGELSKAHDLLRQIYMIRSAPRCEVPIHVLSLTIYLELAMGRSETVKSLLKQHCPQYFSKQQ